jgi:hypothetical protein
MAAPRANNNAPPLAALGPQIAAPRTFAELSINTLTNIKKNRNDKKPHNPLIASHKYATLFGPHANGPRPNEHNSTKGGRKRTRRAKRSRRTRRHRKH